MLKVHVICVGNLKEKYLKEAVAEYQKRLGRFVSLKITEIAEAPLSLSPASADIQRALQKEGAEILAKTAPGDFKIALCVEGEQPDSVAFSELFEKTASAGKSTVDIIIGSSYGLSAEVKSACDKRLSFSRMTFPHQLMRLILMEQLFRAFKINAHEPYHK